MLIVELPGYNKEQKKAIAQKVIQNWFDQNEQLNQDNLEITPEALETLINKTNEKDVQQLKMVLDSIFKYCLLQWAKEANQKEMENKIIPEPFSNIDYEDKSSNHYMLIMDIILNHDNSWYALLQPQWRN